MIQIRTRIIDAAITKEVVKKKTISVWKEITELAIDLMPEKKIDENTYSVDITVGVEDSENTTHQWSETITVISSGNQTRNEIEEQRIEAINNLIININK